MKIYTFTGDKGTTSLASGRRVQKDDIRIEAYGTVDELNSHIGVLAASIKDFMPLHYQFLIKVQNKLFNVGGYLAREDVNANTGVTDADVTEIEHLIDEMQEQTPPFRGFVLPGGTMQASLAHVCRTVTRRCERRVISLAATAPVNEIIIRYINRLSDFFFGFARFNNAKHEIDEILWDKNC